MRVGICGYASSGKDVVADALVENFGFVRVNMSDALDRYLMILDPYVLTQQYRNVRYSELRSEVDYTTAKRNPEVRRLLQKLGTEVGRSIDPDIWIKELDKEAPKHDRVVTTGIRYLNEAAPLDFLIHVDRPGIGPANDHSSESIDAIIALANITFRNDDTIGDLHRQVIERLGGLTGFKREDKT
jgi:hypothetical protein